MSSTQKIIASLPLPALFIEVVWSNQDVLFAPSVLYLLMVLCVSAAYVDVSTHKIPNALTYSVFVTAITMFAIRDWMSAESHSSAFAPVVTAGLLGAGVFLAIMSLTWISCLINDDMIGGGDVKFCVALGLLLGISGAISVLLISHVLAAAFVIVLVFTRVLRASWSKCVSQHHSISLPKLPRAVPMGGFYAGGVFIVIVSAWLRR